MTDPIKDEARSLIMKGESTPIDRGNTGPRSRTHLVRLKNGKTITVIYDRTIGEVTNIVPE